LVKSGEREVLTTADTEPGKCFTVDLEGAGASRTALGDDPAMVEGERRRQRNGGGARLGATAYPKTISAHEVADLDSCWHRTFGSGLFQGQGAGQVAWYEVVAKGG
jgi:hypothetical protein